MKATCEECGFSVEGEVEEAHAVLREHVNRKHTENA